MGVSQRTHRVRKSSSILLWWTLWPRSVQAAEVDATGKKEFVTVGDGTCIGFGAQSAQSSEAISRPPVLIYLSLTMGLSLTRWLQPGDDEGRAFPLTVLTV